MKAEVGTMNRREAIGIGLAGAGLAAAPASAWAASPLPTPVMALRVCGLENPLALGDLPPRFSWEFAVPAKGARQTAWRITVAPNEADLAAGANLWWDSGRIASDQCLDIPYGGPALPSRSRAVWQVEVWTAKSKASFRSTPACWETGLVADADWQAEWLASETEIAKADRMAGLHWITGHESQKVDQVRMFRWTFDSAHGGMAELCLSAHETVGVWINGKPAGALQDGPVRWTQMAVYPTVLATGRNIVAVAVERRVGFGVAPPHLVALLRTGPGLGQRLTSASPGWKSMLAAPEGWQAPDFVDSGWSDAIEAKGTLPIGEPWPVTPATMIRRAFTISRPVRAARLFATALGAYEPWLNGIEVGRRKLAPEYTDPSRRLLYQAYDVGAEIAQGENMIGFLVGDGWYGSKYSTSGRFSFGPAPCRLLAQLEIDYVDGDREVIATGNGWEIADSPVHAASIYDGEVHDARDEKPGWAMTGASASGWRKAETIAAPKVAVDPQRCPPVRINEKLAPVAVTRIAAGRFVVDFGQNFAGWARLSVSAAAGTRIEMRFAEMVGPDGTADQSNLRTAWQRDVYIAAGRGREVWEPRFTYHGFRYVEISGVPDDRSAWSLEGLVGYQDIGLTGTLRVGDPVIQKFWQNAMWSQKSNFCGLPTDCPQRDERLGWMGDAEIFWPAAAYNMDVGAYTARVMEDMRHGQKPNGAFPDCIPPFVPGMNLSSPGWADAGVILPFTSWRQYGDTGVIIANWRAMVAYMDWINASNPDHLWKKSRGADYGDWLSVDASPTNPGDATTPKDLIGTAFWAANASMMAQMAAATGNGAAAAKYNGLFDAIRAAFTAAYVKADGTVGNASQTSYVLAIRFGLLSAQATLEAGRRLAADIARRNDHLSTGFLGTPHILDALAMSAQESAAVTLLLQRSYPSWGYMVEKGATTMWERWNSDQGDTGMNSRNHYAFGAIGSFLFRRVAGIDAIEPGFGKLRIAPIIDARLGSGGATYRSVRGTIRTDWTTRNGQFQLDIDLPAGVTAEVRLPGERRTNAAGSGLSRFSGRLPA